MRIRVALWGNELEVHVGGEEDELSEAAKEFVKEEIFPLFHEFIEKFASPPDVGPDTDGE
jgi:hypothetical protein